MSNIDKQALREIAAAAVGAHERLSVMPPDDIFDISLAEGTQLDADITALNALNSAANPTTVLALLDELDKWQQESSAWQAVAEKQLALAADAEKRIAELEAQEIVPDEMTPKQASRSYCGEVIGYRDGWNACRAAMLQGVEPASNHEELSEENGSSLQLRNLIRQRHAEWSDKTFGCVGPVGPLKHLSKEALEAAAEPDDLSEWADMQFLLWDAQRRAGISDAEITAAMEDKLKINMERQWPEPKDGEPRLHIKEPGNSPVTPDGWISCSERMPEKGQNVLILVNFDSSLVEPLICSARYTGSTFRRGDATIKPGNGIEQATHWMPLPEPPQEVK